MVTLVLAIAPDCLCSLSKNLDEVLGINFEVMLSTQAAMPSIQELRLGRIITVS